MVAERCIVAACHLHSSSRPPTTQLPPFRPTNLQCGPVMLRSIAAASVPPNHRYRRALRQSDGTAA